MLLSRRKTPPKQKDALHEYISTLAETKKRSLRLNPSLFTEPKRHVYPGEAQTDNHQKIPQYTDRDANRNFNQELHFLATCSARDYSSS
jgi:hypothetical protein